LISNERARRGDLSRRPVRVSARLLQIVVVEEHLFLNWVPQYSDTLSAMWRLLFMHTCIRDEYGDAPSAYSAAVKQKVLTFSARTFSARVGAPAASRCC
jgi:hypothetical protein